MNATGLTFVLVLGLIAIWSWQGIAYRENVEEHRAEYERFGDAMLTAAELAVYRECRGGRYDPDELAHSLEEVRAQIDAFEIELFDARGERLALAATPSDPATPYHSFTREVMPPAPRRVGRGRGGRGFAAEELVEVGPEPMALRLHLPQGELEAKLTRDRRRLVVTGTGFSIALTLLVVVLWLRLRSVRLALRLETADERVKALEYLSRLGAGLAHETRTPLGIIRGHAERLGRDEPADDSVRSAARTIVDETDRTLTRLDEFLLLSRPTKPRRVAVRARALVEELAEVLGADAAGRGASVVIDGPDFTLQADHDQLRRLLVNLLLNALQAVDPGGAIHVVLCDIEPRWQIRVEDDGHGIPADVREHMFEPYVTGRPDGTGLGLSIARTIAVEHGWRLWAEDRAPRGTVMIVEGSER